VSTPTMTNYRSMLPVVALVPLKCFASRNTWTDALSAALLLARHQH
jgi:hypothetical protein